MKRILKVLSILLSMAIIVPSVSNAGQGPTIKRLFGDSRVQTSIDISKEAYQEAKTVVLVGYNGEVDALTGGIFAKSQDAPLIFAHKNNLKEIKQRLVALKTEKIYVLGGESVFSKELFDEFKLYNPSRIKGANRFETAVRIAQESIGSTSDKAFLALGIGIYADALAIGPIAAKNQRPIFLTEKNKLPKETRDALLGMKVKEIEILGGPGAVSPAIEKELEKMNIKVNRTKGNTREETAIAIGQKFNLNPKNIVIANGYRYTDAVVAGYFAAQKDAVLLLTNTDKIEKSVLDYIGKNKVDLFVLGGMDVIGPGVTKQILDSNQGSILVDDFNLVEKHAFTKDQSIFLKFDREIDPSKALIDLKIGSSPLGVSQLQAIDNNTGLKVIMKEDLRAGTYSLTISGLGDRPVTETLEVRPIISAGVSTEAQLRDELKDVNVESIVILDDITLKDPLIIDRKVTIQGNNKTFQAPYWNLYDQDDLSLKGVITVLADNVIIKDLTLESKEDINISFQKAKGGELNNVSLIGAGSASLSVFSSQLKAENLKTKSRGYGIGIELSDHYYDFKNDKFVFIENPKLTLIGSHTHESGSSPGNVAVFVTGKDASSKDWIVGGSYAVVEETKGIPYSYSFKLK